jgi:hypothetical protein
MPNNGQCTHDDVFERGICEKETWKHDAERSIIQQRKNMIHMNTIRKYNKDRKKLTSNGTSA